ncbi:hypothetical protein ACFO25_08395 [Paenactinomyces guangxiensis]|uniref:Uncharacterized protein n=1 Tax=Paenactinomyces guangxiensis TaxID=1490290 RepID=A0A7W1WN39_9BACL|nr:hypothetical protein [Paenactinomyces guangxiensis]MBA4492936.1 hypothetical protein [Paenactinomyces guangxiensis]MBH8590215.1 hypothetical protein [Paenactinomyces guangxiensis]
MKQERKFPESSLKRNSFISSQEAESMFSHWEQLLNLFNEISKRSNQIGELLQAVNSLSIAVNDKEKLKEIISSLAKLSQSQAQKKTSKKASGKTNDRPVPPLSGDSFYDVFNSPGMSEIVKEVMKNKKRKR